MPQERKEKHTQTSAKSWIDLKYIRFAVDLLVIKTADPFKADGIKYIGKKIEMRAFTQSIADKFVDPFDISRG